jgi:hypothetical protein
MLYSNKYKRGGEKQHNEAKVGELILKIELTTKVKFDLE